MAANQGYKMKYIHVHVTIMYSNGNALALLMYWGTIMTLLICCY